MKMIFITIGQTSLVQTSFLVNAFCNMFEPTVVYKNIIIYDFDYQSFLRNVLEPNVINEKIIILDFDSEIFLYPIIGYNHGLVVLSFLFSTTINIKTLSTTKSPTSVYTSPRYEHRHYMD